MNQEQFGQFWTQLKAPLKTNWSKITDEDLTEIHHGLARFSSPEPVWRRGAEGSRAIWVNRRYSHWTGNYVGYKDPQPKL